MALVWLPIDEKLLDAALVFASASWERADLDASWVAAGWHVPASGSVADDLFDGLDQRQWTGDRLMTIGLTADCSSIVAVTIEFATFVDPEDEEDEPLVAEDEGWSGLPEGTRADFDETWRAGVAAVTTRLGPPEATGMHGEHWQHAVWRVGDALLALVQGEHIDTYGLWDEAALWLVRHPADAPLLTGDELYDVMWGPVTQPG
ncbi:MAG: hypothetical protein WBA97_13800 [Actinophytocola sp.]|uniref:hypothetical protein n=1 Tax=Actinophytocola sp. TaxID=1872138 RepID=UPI003C7209E5